MRNAREMSRNDEQGDLGQFTDGEGVYAGTKGAETQEIGAGIDQ